MLYYYLYYHIYIYIYIYIYIHIKFIELRGVEKLVIYYFEFE